MTNETLKVSSKSIQPDIKTVTFIANELYDIENRLRNLTLLSRMLVGAPSGIEAVTLLMRDIVKRWYGYEKNFPDDQGKVLEDTMTGDFNYDESHRS